MSARVSRLSQSLRHSSILAIAAEVKALQKQGRQLLDFTVGDFSSKQFPIPTELENATVDALRAGETTYPPSVGVEVLREAVRQFYSRRLGLQFPIDSVL